MKSFREVAEWYGLKGDMADRYVAYMQARWSNEQEIQCKTGYAGEWAQRFLAGEEYNCSDSIGKEVLAAIDSHGGFKRPKLKEGERDERNKGI